MAERVYTVVEFFDRPLAGAADFDGRAHWYRAVFDEGVDDYKPAYQLTPLPDDILSAEVERGGIFSEWLEAYGARQTEMASHPALPERRERHDELTAQIERFLAQAPFATSARPRWLWSNGECQVEWAPAGG